MSKTVRVRLAALTAAVLGVFAAIVALALPSTAAGSLTAPGADPKVSVSGSTVTWGSHLPEAAAAGVVAILFGAGTGTGTQGVPEAPGISQTAPTDYGYWFARVQQYLASPVPLS